MIFLQRKSNKNKELKLNVVSARLSVAQLDLIVDVVNITNT